jgi:polar amino acid transport system substrate-binding protein
MKILSIILFLSAPLILEARTTITLAMFDNPTEWICSDVLKEVYKRAGIDLKTELMPGLRATEESIHGKVDGEVGRNFSYGDIRPTLIRVDPPLAIQGRNIFYNKKLKPNIQKIEDLKKFSVGYVRGMVGIGDLLKNFPNVQVASNSYILLEMLVKGRIEFAIDTAARSSVYLQEKRFKNIESKEIQRIPIHHYLHVKNKKIVPIISNELKKLMKTGEYQKLYLKAETDFYKSGKLLNEMEDQ